MLGKWSEGKERGKERDSQARTDGCGQVAAAATVNY